MRKILMLGIALATLGAAAPVMAQTSNADAGAVVGAGAGGAGGAVIGGLVGGPIGALIGGFAGAVIGSETVSDAAVRYAAENPVDVVYIDGVSVGSSLDTAVTVYPIEGDDQFGYFYANNRIYIVDLETREVVQSPGYLMDQNAVAYIEANPTTSISIDADLSAGYQFDDGVEITPIPDNQYYGYVYAGDRPVLVDRSNRTVVWVR